jgi:hypothetical protein
MRGVEAVEDGSTRGSSQVKRAAIGVAQAMLVVALVPRWKARAHSRLGGDWHAERAHSWAVAGAVAGKRGRVRWWWLRAGSSYRRRTAREGAAANHRARSTSGRWGQLRLEDAARDRVGAGV